MTYSIEVINYAGAICTALIGDFNATKHRELFQKAGYEILDQYVKDEQFFNHTDRNKPQDARQVKVFYLKKYGEDEQQANQAAGAPITPGRDLKDFFDFIKELNRDPQSPQKFKFVLNRFEEDIKPFIDEREVRAIEEFQKSESQATLPLKKVDVRPKLMPLEREEPIPQIKEDQEQVAHIIQQIRALEKPFTGTSAEIADTFWLAKRWSDYRQQVFNLLSPDYNKEFNESLFAEAIKNSNIPAELKGELSEQLTPLREQFNYLYDLAEKAHQNNDDIANIPLFDSRCKAYLRHDNEELYSPAFIAEINAQTVKIKALKTNSNTAHLQGFLSFFEKLSDSLTKLGKTYDGAKQAVGEFRALVFVPKPNTSVDDHTTCIEHLKQAVQQANAALASCAESGALLNPNNRLAKLLPEMNSGITTLEIRINQFEKKAKKPQGDKVTEPIKVEDQESHIAKAPVLKTNMRLMVISLDEVAKKANELDKRGFTKDAAVINKLVADLRKDINQLKSNLEITPLLRAQNLIIKDFKTSWNDRINELKNDEQSPLNTHRGLFWRLIQSIQKCISFISCIVPKTDTAAKVNQLQQDIDLMPSPKP